MVLMPMFLFLRPMSGATFPNIGNCVPHLGPSTYQAQDQLLVLSGLAFSSSSDELEGLSSSGYGHFLCLLQEKQWTSQ